MQRQLIPAAMALVLSCTMTVAHAQKNQPADSREAVNRMAKELGLSEAQRNQVETILNAERKKVEAVFNEEKNKLQRIQEQTRISLQAVLTPEQMEKLENKMRQQNSKNNAQK
ncbi:hypothetical protein [Nitrosomonas sp. sh817]|uniref:hypothetical protein n=1 Tax=Nitrosomonas sp. sh817 TaxID=3070658 RepID=UPI0027DAD66A|nr:hypothetical protein [Nitrosomonas sp. sh817]WMJ08751.1 hypothetical protein RBH92_00655 [Nitrosomonas sp. sh817]